MRTVREKIFRAAYMFYRTTEHYRRFSPNMLLLRLFLKQSAFYSTISQAFLPVPSQLISRFMRI